MAHARMLYACELLSASDHSDLQRGLRQLLRDVELPSFKLPETAEDIHSFVEAWLIEQIGEAGKRLHTARSRNDQVLTAIKIYLRFAIQEIVQQISDFSELLLQKAEQHRDIGLPGYTHFQAAMPSSFGLWFSAWAEALSDDLLQLQAAYRLADRNPLGSAAGYGSSFAIDRELTTDLLGFSGMHINVVNAQLNRGKTERVLADALAAIGITLSRFSADCCLFMSTNFGFIRFPDHLTTGSSLMPHKKNPDVFELVRARCNALQAIPQQLALLATGMPSGYHRDFQLTKELLFPALDTMNACFDILKLMIQEIEVESNLLEKENYNLVYTVDAVNQRMQQGVSFRDAYREIGIAVEQGNFVKPELIAHRHIGSRDVPGFDRIHAELEQRVAAFDFKKMQLALENLLTIN
jgi:argininosuccinate lyase